MSVDQPSEPMIEVNGTPRAFAAGETVADLVQRLEIPAAQVAVELNRAILPRDRYTTQVLQDGDRLEIVSFVGGG